MVHGNRSGSHFWSELGRIEGWGVGRCLKCDHSLRQVTENQCPACGQAFDPADAQTMRWGDSGGSTASGMPTHMRRWVVAAVVLLVLATVLIKW